MSAKTDRLTPEEYLVIEDAAPYRSEFFDGAMLAMRDRSYSNALINGNLMRWLHSELRGSPWEFLSSAMRVLIPSLPLYTYPDASIVRRPARTAAHSATTLIDPVLIVEVLSPPGESYERRATFQRFQKIDPLMHYVTISQESARVDHYWRMSAFTPDEWIYIPYEGMDAVLSLPPLNIALPLKDIYEGVEFPGPGTTKSHKHPDHDHIF